MHQKAATTAPNGIKINFFLNVAYKVIFFLGRQAHLFHTLILFLYTHVYDAEELR
jgi:hypothetical protein